MSDWSVMFNCFAYDQVYLPGFAYDWKVKD